MLIALLIESNGIQQLVVGLVVACLIELLCQIGQLIGVSDVVALHIGDQSDQLLHGGVVVLMRMLMGMRMCMVVGVVVSMAVGMLCAVVGVSMGVLTAAAVLMFMGAAVLVQMLVRMRMLVVVAMTVGVAVSMLYTVVSMSMGVFVGMFMAVCAMMIVFKMHKV